MAVIFAHPSFQYFAQDGEMGKNKKALKIKRFQCFAAFCHF